MRLTKDSVLIVFGAVPEVSKQMRRRTTACVSSISSVAKEYKIREIHI
jgi:hypothetical protein